MGSDTNNLFPVAEIIDLGSIISSNLFNLLAWCSNFLIKNNLFTSCQVRFPFKGKEIVANVRNSFDFRSIVIKKVCFYVFIGVIIGKKLKSGFIKQIFAYMIPLFFYL